MKTILISDPVRYSRMTTPELRECFLADGLFKPGEIQLNYVDLDRAVVGMAVPVDRPLTLSSTPELRADYFTERRELGALNIGGPGVVYASDAKYDLENLDLIYIGRGNPDIRFESKSADNPAVFYLLSYPAHTAHPVTVVRKADAQPTEIGASATSNRRTIYKYIHMGGAKSCQLVMGLTVLDKGSVWNTMPSHTHTRRMEAYFYFDVPEGQVVFHFMGEPHQTRHLVLSAKEAVISPPWSIHAGCGTSSYSFIWGMAGENKSFADMDFVEIKNLK